jgi:hypothetical protein
MMLSMLCCLVCRTACTSCLTDKKLFGIIAAVELSEMLKKRVLEAGFYVARIQDETLCWSRLTSFKPSVFSVAMMSE